jgi:hypothetical protein
MGLYHALVTGDAPDRRRANVDATVDAFLACSPIPRAVFPR